MRIALISTPCVAVPPRAYGGTELIIAELAKGLVERGHQVTLFATGDSDVSGVELRYVYEEAHWPPSMYTDLNHVSWAMREVESGMFDIVHAHNAVALAVARCLISTPLVYTLHHARVDEMSAYYANFPNTQFVAISHDQRRRETPLPQMAVIHHGLDPSQYEWRMQPKNFVCFLGRLAEEKGPHTAIDAAADAGVDIRVAGSVHSVDARFGTREVQPRLRLPHVTYLGSIGLPRKVPLLRDARALLAPLGWDEPFGLAMVEAMLSGCPVVAYPRGSMPELIEPGVTGLLVNNRAELVEAIRPGGPVDAIDRRRCAELAAQRFSASSMVRDHEVLYGRVVRRRAPNAAPVAARTA